MKNNTILIIGILSAAALAAYIFLKPNSASKAKKETSKSDSKVEQVKKEAEEKVEKKVPDNLKQCPEDIFSSMDECFDLEENTVCGYDHTIYEDGSEKDHGLEYKTPCHYCNFFGEDLEKDMMGTKVEALGYTEGSCN